MEKVNNYLIIILIIINYLIIIQKREILGEWECLCKSKMLVERERLGEMNRIGESKKLWKRVGIVRYRQSTKVILGGNLMDGIKAGPGDDQLTTQLRVSYMLHYNAE